MDFLNVNVLTEVRSHLLFPDNDPWNEIPSLFYLIDSDPDLIWKYLDNLLLKKGYRSYIEPIFELGTNIELQKDGTPLFYGKSKETLINELSESIDKYVDQHKETYMIEANLEKEFPFYLLERDYTMFESLIDMRGNVIYGSLKNALVSKSIFNVEKSSEHYETYNLYRRLMMMNDKERLDLFSTFIGDDIKVCKYVKGYKNERIEDVLESYKYNSKDGLWILTNVRYHIVMAITSKLRQYYKNIDSGTQQIIRFFSTVYSYRYLPAQSPLIKLFIERNKSNPFELKINQQKDLFSFENLVVDLKTGESRLRKREDYLTQTSKVQWGIYTEEEMKIVKNFFHDSLNGDSEMIDFVQRWLGCAMTGYMAEYRLVMWMIPPELDEILINIMKEVFGPYKHDTNLSNIMAKLVELSDDNPDIYERKDIRFWIGYSNDEIYHKLITNKNLYGVHIESDFVVGKLDKTVLTIKKFPEFDLEDPRMFEARFPLVKWGKAYLPDSKIEITYHNKDFLFTPGVLSAFAKFFVDGAVKWYSDNKSLKTPKKAIIQCMDQLRMSVHLDNDELNEECRKRMEKIDKEVEDFYEITE